MSDDHSERLVALWFCAMLLCWLVGFAGLILGIGNHGGAIANGMFTMGMIGALGIAGIGMLWFFIGCAIGKYTL